VNGLWQRILSGFELDCPVAAAQFGFLGNCFLAVGLGELNLAHTLLVVQKINTLTLDPTEQAGVCAD
jgi:hypothetical protein